ncbi:MAG: GHMP kinase [Ignavibacteria bacterium]|nr:GHMP kinase [Ignavibacteria bacterium]MBI3766370.1 GHMP kinase [Ignavibacteriales bacterium]
MTNFPSLTVSTPGRICLFGEHQDYLDLPVIPCAVSLRVAIETKRRSDSLVHISLPDIGSEISFSLDRPLNYGAERDYFRSGIKIMRKQGFIFSQGFDCCVMGKIPIRAGTSSSSALVVSWINLLAQMSDRPRELTPEECADLAYRTEVLEFNEPGGKMDQYSTSLGGILLLKFYPTLRIEKLNPLLRSFVLGDSREPKDTRMILARVKNNVLTISRILSEKYPGCSLHTVLLEEIDHYAGDLSTDQRELLIGTLRNRDITREAHILLMQKTIDERMFGDLLNEHQSILRDVLHISTPKIDRMLEAALRAGAFGGKINGSGGGGCMFAYAPEHPEAVAQAIEKEGGTAYIVHVDSGTRVERAEVVD